MCVCVATLVNGRAKDQMSIAAISNRCVHRRAVDRSERTSDHWWVAEYALVTAVMASLAVSLATIPQAQLSRQLPVTAAKAQALVTKSAKSSGVPITDARAAMTRAPFSRPQLKYLYAAGWIGGRKRPADCAFAKVTPGAIAQEMLATIRKDTRLVSRLRRMNVTLGQAADALTKGTASAC